jgi:hypothetical protein
MNATNASKVSVIWQFYRIFSAAFFDLVSINTVSVEFRNSTCYTTVPEQELVKLKQDTEAILYWITNMHSRYMQGEVGLPDTTPAWPPSSLPADVRRLCR